MPVKIDAMMVFRIMFIVIPLVIIACGIEQIILHIRNTYGDLEKSDIIYGIIFTLTGIVILLYVLGIFIFV